MRKHSQKILSIEERELLEEIRGQRKTLLKFIKLHVEELDEAFLTTPLNDERKVIHAKARSEGARQLLSLLEKSLSQPLL